jgi:predicted nucleotidyltransferase
MSELASVIRRPASRMAALRLARAEERAKRARLMVDAVLARLMELGLEAKLVGSLAEGGFLDHSDVDILVHSAPDEKTRILAFDASQALAAQFHIPCDLIFADETWHKIGVSHDSA